MKSAEFPLRKAPIRTAEILCVGTELLLGDIVNTNAAFLAKALASLGISVYHQTVVGDHPGRLRAALEDAFEGRNRPAADLVILSGGLGPTYDDLTKETVATFFGRSMYLHQDSLSRIKDYFARRGRPMTTNNEKQAMMPTGAIVLDNDWGTAPALAVGDDTHTAVLLPGPPTELIPLFNERVIPLLRPFCEQVLISHNINIIGIGESAVEELLRDLMVSADNPTIAPYCAPGEVRIRVTARAKEEATAEALCQGTVTKVLELVGDYVYGTDLPGPEYGIVQTFAARGLTIACAESCTGGMIGQRLTSVPGASAVFAGGFMTYTNRAKIDLLGVSPDTIATYTEVSAPAAAEMAEGARRALGCDIAISTTGYAGPGGGTETEPVGTVYVGVASASGTQTVRLSYAQTKSRDYIRTAASSEALCMALRAGLFVPSPKNNRQ